MAAEPHHLVFKNFLKKYEDVFFINKDGSLNTITNVKILTDLLQCQGLKLNNEYQILSNDIIIYPNEFFHHMIIEFINILLLKIVIVCITF